LQATSHESLGAADPPSAFLDHIHLCALSLRAAVFLGHIPCSLCVVVADVRTRMEPSQRFPSCVGTFFVRKIHRREPIEEPARSYLRHCIPSPRQIRALKVGESLAMT